MCLERLCECLETLHKCLENTLFLELSSRHSFKTLVQDGVSRDIRYLSRRHFKTSKSLEKLSMCLEKSVIYLENLALRLERFTMCLENNVTS